MAILCTVNVSDRMYAAYTAAQAAIRFAYTHSLTQPLRHFCVLFSFVRPPYTTTTTTTTLFGNCSNVFSRCRVFTLESFDSCNVCCCFCYCFSLCLFAVCMLLLLFRFVCCWLLSACRWLLCGKLLCINIRLEARMYAPHTHTHRQLWRNHSS